MQIITHLESLSAGQRGAVVALGNFDGIHLGHQVVIGEARDKAKAARVPFGVMTFDPHPRRFFDSKGSLFELTPTHAKSRHLAACGIDLLFLMSFDATLAAMPAEQFVKDILVDGAGVSQVITGYDFVFG
jgi:riboflavin kinase/FMN adenylyltransferase